MSLFSQKNHSAVQDVSAGDQEYIPTAENAMQKLAQLHDVVYPQLTNNDLDLYPPHKNSHVVFESASTSTQRGLMALQYMRSHTQAVRIERLMGRDETTNNGVESRRHPVIEIRLTPEYLAVELILSPYAWWDQQNLVGKLTIDRHQANFFNLLKKLDEETCIGFWRGVKLDEMHVKVGQLHRQHIWNEWVSTFDPGRDWFRVGRWYEPESEAISEANITNELITLIRGLHNLYADILWSSNNNYREFYDASGKK